MCICNACQFGKFKRTVYPANNNRTQKSFQLIHCDVWGPSPHTDILGHRYFLVCTDDHSRFSWLFLLKAKSEVTTNIKNLCKMIKCQFGDPVKGLRTDNAKDFLNQELREFLAFEGIKHETSCPYTPQQNGLAERKLGDIVDKGRTLLIQASTPLNLWGFAVMTAVHLINKLPSRILGFKSPLEILEEKYPGVRLKTGLPVKIFGCIPYVHNLVHKQNKWSTKALKCVFLGYSLTQKGYKVYHPLTRKYLVSKDVVFDETTFYYPSTVMKELRELPYLTIPEKIVIQENKIQDDNRLIQDDTPQLQLQDSPSAEVNLEVAGEDHEPIVPYPKYYERRKKRGIQALETNQGSQETIVENTEAMISAEGGEEMISAEGGDGWPITLRKGKRSSVKTLPYDITNYLNFQNVSSDYRAFITQIQDIPIPKNTEEAMRNNHRKGAMDEEMRALLQNHTWDIVNLPKGKKPVNCRWVYTLKCKSDVSLDRYKARLVARGYTQTFGVDYQETFAPVAKINTIRILISLAVNLDWPLNQYDIKNAFLHGDLKEEIYMDIPSGFGGPAYEGKVCKLNKALYGLKQSPRAWFGRFTQAMKALGYQQCNGEHTLFFKTTSLNLLTVLIVYVDDIIITGNNLEEITCLERHLHRNFQVKQLGPLKYFLGIEFVRSSEGILMTQQKYILFF